MALAASDVRTILTGALLAIFLAALEQTIVATALPSIAADLGDFELISWVVTAYLLSSVCATPIFGKLSDIYGRRPVLAACLAAFLGGSVLCALAPSMVALILARGIQGLGGGGLVTLAHAIVADVISPRERGRYAGYFSATWMAAALLGPGLGGVLAEHAGWQWIFWLNVPLCLAVMLLSDRALKKLPVAKRQGSVDYLGIALLSVGVVALLLVLSEASKDPGWSAPHTIALALAAAAASAAFAWRQGVTSQPILPPRFLSDRVVGPVLVAGFLVFGSYLTIVVATPIYFQVALRVSASESGLLMIPMMLSTSVGATFAGGYTRRRGRYRQPPLVSLPISIAGLVLLALFVEELSPAVVACVLAAVGVGVGTFFPCGIVAAQSAVAPHDLGAVSGAIGFSRALGGAILTAAGTALVLGTITRTLPDLGAIGDLGRLAHTAMAPNAQAIVADAFADLFWVTAGTILVGLLIFARIEDRLLHGQSGAERAAIGE